ncbi:MAG TPA: cytochrome C [Gammaproteobacteria bacterium]|nr:cytochrome C [Gammaproteobacteria bacterium]
MNRAKILLLSVFIAVLSSAAHGEPPAAVLEGGLPVTDLRKLVEMPEQARQVLREDMLDQFAVLNEIIEFLALNDFAAAAELAEDGMGQSLLRKHQDRDFGPARYMPEEMRRMGWDLHEAASNFSLVAKRGDRQATLVALQKITEACIACHYSYRTH